MTYADWTLLAACHVKDRFGVRLRFGRPVRLQRIDDGLTHYWFQPGQTFAIAWWARVSPRRQFAAFAVAESLPVGQAGLGLPCVHPAVRVHAFLNCRCVGKDRGAVGCADELVQRIQSADIDPFRVPPIYYRLAGQALRVGHAPRRIDREELVTFLEEQKHEN
jgi:hypothetical protein